MAVLSKQHVPPLYNLNHFIINCPIFQYVHKFFTVCSHFVHFSISLLFPVPFRRRSVCRILCLLLFPLPPASIYIIRFIIVNPAGCTKNMFCFRLIHTVHNHFPENVQKLYTAPSVHFAGKSSYTPTYPHYPHFFSVYHQFSPDKESEVTFCTHLINFPFSTKNTRFCLDKYSPPAIVRQPGSSEKNDAHILSFAFFEQHSPHMARNIPHF